MPWFRRIFTIDEETHLAFYGGDGNFAEYIKHDLVLKCGAPGEGRWINDNVSKKCFKCRVLEAARQ